jgi:glucose/arabinose dehydrogenase
MIHSKKSLSSTLIATMMLLGSGVGLAALPDDVTIVNVHPNNTFSDILAYLQAPDDSDRFFAVRRTGQVHVIDSGTVLPTLFLNLGSYITSGGTEQGLLGMAFHPDFASNGLFYLNYSAGTTRPPGTASGDTIVAEFSVSSDPNIAIPDPERIILSVHQDFANHNGGKIAFGPDGYLYIGMGDGGSGGDPCNRSQTLHPDDLVTAGVQCTNNPPDSAALLGKMLRIDVDNTTPAGSNNLCAAAGDGSANYSVPSDNPFFNDASACGEIWSYGLRNPWRWSFDRDTGDLWIADVGQNAWEEVNLESASSPGGLNYGWNCFEGESVYTSSPHCSSITHFPPVMVYPISGQAECAVTGGYRYRGPVTSLNGLYLFADFCSRRLFVAEDDSGWSFQPDQIIGSGSGWADGVSSFGEDRAGHVYVMQRNGAVWTFSGATEPPSFSIGGTVSGLAGSGLVLQNNGGDDLEIDANGNFQFVTELEDGEDYLVTVATQPSDPLQECTVVNGSGQVDGADVTDIQVLCETEAFTVGGTVSGLAGSGLVLQNNGGDDLAIAENGAFVFDTELAGGQDYAVTVLTQPSSPAQTCTVSNGSGTIDGAAIDDITVDCVTDSFTVGGTVSGLDGSGLVLHNKGGDDLSISTNGSFTFATALPDGTSFEVSVFSQPVDPLQACTVSNGQGQLDGANFDGVEIVCVTELFTIGGVVSGLEGSGLVLQNNGADNLSITTDGGFQFATGLAQGQSYLVTVASQPTGPLQDCQVSNAEGTVDTSDINTVEVECTTLNAEIFDDRFEAPAPIN